MEEFLRSYITPQASLTIRWASTVKWKNSYDLTLHHKHHWQQDEDLSWMEEFLRSYITPQTSLTIRWASTVKWKNSYDLTLHHKHHWQQDKHLQLNGRILTILHYTTSIADNKMSIYSWMEEFLRSYITPQASLTIRWGSQLNGRILTILRYATSMERNKY